MSDILLNNGIIEKISPSISSGNCTVIDASGQTLLPGVIDDQVHFREPGLTWKGDIYSESRAAVAGGTTSYMEMPNTVPPALTQDLLEEKYVLAAHKSLANYSFFMGASNQNIEEIKRTNPENICGVKIFMGSSTGNLLVDNEKALENIFRESPVLIATHCEDEQMIRSNTEKFRHELGENPPLSVHPNIRSVEACFKSSSYAVSLAEKFNSRLHILHVSTARELTLFRNDIPLEDKKITAEACIHHLWFCDEDYERLGNFIKWNPAIKTKNDRDELLKALLDKRLDIIATDHAPHTLEEKQHTYFNAPSGGPLVQHALSAMLEFYYQKKLTLEQLVEKMSHHPAVCYQLKNRGFIREGFFADLVLVDLHQSVRVEKSNILYKCGWSPFEGQTFHSQITHTFVNGNLVFEQGKFNESEKGIRLLFER